jgi:hypothetical protein|tara:strand:+ start:265 stop:543 length:279 start_codon:yes stop_codon:yes gene_type:complete
MRLEESFEKFLNEDNSNFVEGHKADELHRRHKMNLQRYKSAQERGDNYNIKYYELRLKLDGHDLEKMKLRTAIKQLKKKWGKIAVNKDSKNG